MDNFHSLVKELFKKADASIKINISRKEETHKALLEILPDKQYASSVNWLEIIKNQIFYMDKWIFFIQFAVCTIAIFIILALYHTNTASEDIIAMGMILSGVLGAASVWEVCYLFFSDITELGESCFFNVRQMVLLQLGIAGFFYLFILTFVIFYVGMQWKLNLLQVGFYFMVPFIVSECGCIASILTEIGRKSPLFPVLAGLFSALFFSALSTIPTLYQTTATLLWGVAFFLGMLLLGLLIRKLLKEIEKGEILCAN